MEILTTPEKKQAIANILGADHIALGNHFPVYNMLIDNLGHFNNVATLAELVPALNGWLSSSAVSAFISTASFAGILLFPVQNLISLVNANEVGLRMYCFRAIAYTITAWAFDKNIPISSPRVIQNLQSGVGHVQGGIDSYHKAWKNTSEKALIRVRESASVSKTPSKNLKLAFKALGNNSPSELCLLLLKGFEKDFSPIVKPYWSSNYSILYPH